MKLTKTDKHSLRWGRMLLSVCTVAALLVAMLAGCTPTAPVEVPSEPEISSAVESEVASEPEVSSAVESEIPSEPEESSAAESEAVTEPEVSSAPVASSKPAPVASSRPVAVSSAPVVVSSAPVVVSSAPAVSSASVSSAAASSQAQSLAEQTGKRRIPVYIVVEDTLTDFTVALSVDELTSTIYDASDFKAAPDRPGYNQLRLNVQTLTPITIGVSGADIDEAIASERSGRDYIYSDIYKLIEDVSVGSSEISFNISAEDPVDTIQLTIA